MKTNYLSRIVVLLFLILSMQELWAQPPQSFKYQAILRNAAGEVLTNQAVAVRISLLRGSENGDQVYTETHQGSTNGAGMFVLNIGEGIDGQGLAGVDWSLGPYYLKIEVDPAGGTDYKNMGTSPLLSVPYALYSGGSDGWSTASNGIFREGNVGVGETDPQSKLEVAANPLGPVDEALFVVKNNQGDTVFAVFNEGVRINVPEGAKGGKGGFAVSGKTSGKGAASEIFRVTPDSVRVWVNNAGSRKGGKGGFAVGGRSAKGVSDNFLTLTPENYYIGHLSGLKNTTGYYNTFFGYHAGQENTEGYENIFIGNEAGIDNTDGYSNIFVGSFSGSLNTTGRSNVFMGTWSGYNNTSGYWNSFIGRQAGYYNTEGFSNIFIGDWAGHSNSTGMENVYIGDYAGGQNELGNSNVYIGAETGTYSSGVKNIFIGAYAGQNAGADSNNIFIGTNAGYYSETGINNIFMGNNSGYLNSTGSENVFLGSSTGENNSTGSNNIFMGNLAGNSNTSGSHNIFLGNSSGSSNDDGDYNILIGYKAGSSILSGYSNNFMGDEAGLNTLNGSNNTFIGDWTGRGNSSGSKNTYLGAQAGYTSTASAGNVFIGYTAGYSETASNRLYIENSTADNTTALIYGEFDNNYLRFNADVGINHSPYSDVGLSVNMDANDTYAIYATGYCYSTVGWGYPSDARWKKNITDLDFSLDNLKSIRTVSFDWNREEYPEMKFSDKRDFGVIAQELEKILPTLVTTDPRGFKSVDYSKLSVVLLKSVQEQQEIIEKQQNQINDLIGRVKSLEGQK
jgi:trimeric autotransporter adhesin